MTPDASAVLADWRARIESDLDHVLSDTFASTRLADAMRHAVQAGGKRIRPLLVHATVHAVGGDGDHARQAAVAVELLHTYSLVHDDLPAMDDDALRRGQPTVHVAFDEATAILAGDALQTLAFEILAHGNVPADVCVKQLRELAHASGIDGMCGGQMLDLEATGTADVLSLDALERLHALKTGALLRAAVRMGALAGNADDAQRAALDRYADALGLAFQIRDDLLDIEGDSATLGKTAGKDVEQAKSTFPALLGIEASRQRLAQLAITMDDALVGFDQRADPLRAIARQVIERDR
ncbi:polyprenyl synthetase family protein [Solilutibacter silvestris]|uniref:Geranylgeranyl pyrophosphate synthase n=1 Tax=Solilutibacter silvestris TaxID=1645665 RepID=A0A2K1Q3B6_9GAMM|nr:farnesyl diphosphate synthase [Lysobacter silvestris]PNS09535.1 Geranylgeranyl pyrophosphate synthase [Lysobacter silvestris]